MHRPLALIVMAGVVLLSGCGQLFEPKVEKKDTATVMPVPPPGPAPVLPAPQAKVETPAQPEVDPGLAKLQNTWLLVKWEFGKKVQKYAPGDQYLMLEGNQFVFQTKINGLKVWKGTFHKYPGTEGVLSIDFTHGDDGLVGRMWPGVYTFIKEPGFGEVLKLSLPSTLSQPVAWQRPSGFTEFDNVFTFKQAKK